MDSIRLNWLDIAKGIGILLMVLGHSAIPILISTSCFSYALILYCIRMVNKLAKEKFHSFCQKNSEHYYYPLSFIHLLY